MSQFLNHVTIAAPRNGSATHTVTPSSGTVVAGSTFTPTAGRLLVVVVEGAVTSTTPSGWTLPSGGSAINNTGLYVWYRTAAGSDSLTTTHNGSDYPVVFDFYEYPATATWVGVVSATAVNPGGGAGPTLSGLTGTNQVYAVGGQATSASFVGPWSGSWSAGTEIVDTSAAYATTDGYTFGVSEFVDYASSTASAAWTSTNGSGATVERLVWAVTIPAAYVPPTYPARATWYTGLSPRPTAALLGSTARNVGFDMLLGTTVATNTGTLAASLPRTAATLTGTQTDTGTLAAAAPVLTAALTGTATNVGTLAASTIRATSTITGTSTDTGTLTASAPIATASLTGASTNPATLSASAPLITASIADTTVVTGTLSASLPRITTSLTGTQANAGTFAATTPTPTAALAGASVNSGTMAASIVRPTATIAGTMTNGATMTTATVVPVAALTGSSTNAAALTVSTPRLTMQASGSVVNLGALTASTPAVTALLSGTVTNGATLTAALPLVTFATISAYLPLVDADHMRIVPARNGTRTVEARTGRTVPARGATRTVEARDSTRTVTARPYVRRVP